MMSVQHYENIRQADAYSLFRKSPPQGMIDIILQYLQKELLPPYTLAVDVGCGTGQSSVILSPFFDQVIGYDVSKAQIQQANNRWRAKNVSYKVCPAEKLPLESNSAQLITAGTCLHWLDTERFFQEARRVLVPGGTMAVYCSYAVYPVTGDVNCDSEIRALTNQLLFEELKPYRSLEVYSVFEEYRNIEFPFKDLHRISNIRHEYPGYASDAAGYIKSMSTYQNMMREEPEEASILLDSYQSQLMEIIGCDEDPKTTNLRFCREFFLILGRNYSEKRSALPK